MLRRQRNLPISANDVPAARNGPAGARSRSGFTLVEMMVAVMIITIGLLGLASTAGYVVKQISGGTQQTLAATAVQTRTDWMLSRPCTSIKNDSTTPTKRGVTEHWITGAKTNNVLQVTDTVKYSLVGSWAASNKYAHAGTKTNTFTIMVPCW